MNSSKLFAALALTLAAACTSQVFAQAPAAPNTPRVDRREANQQARINQGVGSGQLTGTEASRLQNQQNRINSAEAKAKADGVVTKKERADITRKQNRANRDIRRAKHNKKVA